MYTAGQLVFKYCDKFWEIPSSIKDVPTEFVIRCIVIFQWLKKLYTLLRTTNLTKTLKTMKSYYNHRVHHVMLIVGEYNGAIETFEYAPPISKFDTYSSFPPTFKIGTWRKINDQDDPHELDNICQEHEGQAYDYLELLYYPVPLHILNKAGAYVCGSGVQRILEEWTSVYMFGKPKVAMPSELADLLGV